MGSQEFIVLYTHQKMKKAKVWQDGTLKLWPSGNKAVLCDDKGACLESLFLKCLEVKPGDDLESDRYLITVEEVKGAASVAVRQEVVKEAPGSQSRSPVSSGRSRGCQPPGLKRKFTGFQGPRQVPKKMVVTGSGDSSASFEAGAAFLPPFPSTPPLFSIVGQQETDNTLAGPEGTACTAPVCVAPGLAVLPARSARSAERILALLKPAPAAMPGREDAREAAACLATYSPLRGSLAAASAPGGADMERQCAGHENEATLRDLLVHKWMQASGTHAEKGRKHHEDESRDHEEESESPPLGGSSSLLGHRGGMEKREKGRLLAEAACCAQSPASLGEVMPQEGAPGCAGPAQSPPASSRPLAASSLCSDSRSPERLDSTQESTENGAQPFWEVTFNLSTFETSDSEEESRAAGSRVRWLQGDQFAQRLSQGPGCQEICGARGLHSASPGEKWTEECPVQETLSQFCDKTCVGFDTGPCEDGDAGEAVEEECSDLSAVGSDGVCEDNKEDTKQSAPQIRSHFDFASLSNKSKGTDGNLHIPHFLNIATRQSSKNNDLLSDTQPLPFISGSNLDEDAELVFPAVSGGDSSTQPLASSQGRLECTELKSSDSQACGSLLVPRETMHRDTEVCIPECEDLGRSQSLSHGHIERKIARNSRQSWNNPSNTSELPGVGSSISLLKSLSEHSTALESLEMLKKPNAILPQQGALQVEEPESRIEARKPFTRIPFTPHLKQDSQRAVEFQGHQVKGSASSSVMVRGPGSQPQCSPFPDNAECKDLADMCLLPPKLTHAQVQSDLLQVASPEQRICTLSAVSALSLASRHEDFMVEFSAESLRARTLPGMRRSCSLENKNVQRPALASRAQAPLAAWPLAPDPCGCVTSCGCPGPAAPPPPPGARPVPAEPGDALGPGSLCPPSKWLKYREPACGASPALGPCPASPGATCAGHPGRGRCGAERLGMIRAALRRPRPDLAPAWTAPRATPRDTRGGPGIPACIGCHAQASQEISGSELCFPSGPKTRSAPLPRRQMRVPAVFLSAAHYRQTFESCIIEHLNILLFELAQRLHRALSKVDISFYMSSKEENLESVENSSPICHHRQPAKLIMAKKEGPNKGRLFYACARPRADRCQFFKWLEEAAHPRGAVLQDAESVGLYLRSQKVPVYEGCQLAVRKGFDFQRKQYGKLKKFTTVNTDCYNEPKSKLYLKLSRKESSSVYSKDDLWVISKTLDFELDTFIACSAFFGPSSANEVELLPLKGYFPSRWPTNTVVHALLVCNASSELTALKNIQASFHPGTLPLTPHLLAMPSPLTVCNERVSKSRFTPPAFTNNTKCELPGLEAALRLAEEMVQAHGLNRDQAAALAQAARMMAAPGSVEGAEEWRAHTLPITVIHGVFGAGKSYLLAVVVLFFVHLFEQSDAPAAGNMQPWKLLVSSSTNVAVDRVLLGLLSFGFDKFVRVGSIRKIAKPILPYSLHAGSEDENEQLRELRMLMEEDLTPAERACVRSSIQQHRLGATRALLRQVRVVGVTCAACPFPCMDALKFPVVLLDECSQMTEPASLLPIARFECEKLILVGDPKQLPPTIQGSEAAHENGLEQTLFDRLCLMGHKPVLLRTQYRCHPAISAVANDLFYGGNLQDGVSEVERDPLLQWLPTLCFYNVTGQEQMERDNSFHNVAEASFTLKMIQSLIASGISGSVIGVITLYKSQMYKLCHSLSAGDFSHPDMKAVQVSTVDAFQGAEKEIIILSCVRTRHVGFIDSETRMNVALTRGRRHLLIVGNLACLRRNRLWGRVIQHCEGREDGLQHASQCEPQLNRLLKDYFEKQAEEKQKKKSKKEKAHSQKEVV